MFGGNPRRGAASPNSFGKIEAVKAMRKATHQRLGASHGDEIRPALRIEAGRRLRNGERAREEADVGQKFLPSA